MAYSPVPPSSSWVEVACALLLHSWLGVMVAATVKRLCIHYVIDNECITKNGFECKYTGPKLSVQRAQGR